ncbi:Sugar transporter ERD6-like 17 [Linum perenne]
MWFAPFIVFVGHLCLKHRYACEFTIPLHPIELGNLVNLKSLNLSNIMLLGASKASCGEGKRGKMHELEGSLNRKPLLGELSSSSTPVTATVIFSTSIAVCGSFAYGCAMSYPSPAQSGIMEDLGLSVATYSIFGSAMNVGGMIGALFCGAISAVVGRKYTMWLSQVFCTIGWLSIILAKNEWWLYMGRLSIGFGVGFVTYMVPIYIAEITPKEYRGGFAYASQLLANCGFSIIYFLGNVVSWRNLAIIGLAPGILQLMGLFFVPESPRWLAQVGRRREFEASLKSLRGKDTDINQEKQEIQEMVDAFNDRKDAKLTDLFQKKYAYSLTVGVGLMVFQQFGGVSGVASYASAIVQRSGDFLFMVIKQYVPAAAAGLFLMDYAGRKPVLMVSAGGMCLCSILVGVAFVLQLYIATFSIGVAGVPWIIMSEIFPMSVKAVAGSLVTLVSWSASTFNFMLQWSPAGTFFIFAGMCGASIMFTWKLVPETKGRTLEEIQSSMISLQ